MICRKTIKGKKIWLDDNNNAHNTRPQNIQINLLQNGEIYKTAFVDSMSGGAYAFSCLPVYDKDGKKYTYAVDEVTPPHYAKTINGFNITNRYDQEFILTYNFNNIVHNNYRGTVYTSKQFLYLGYSTVAVQDKSNIFSEYGGENSCQFVGWNTLANGNGTYYYQGDTLLLSQNLTLYAIWKSCKPNVNDIYTDDRTVSGTGVIGVGGVRSYVYVKFPVVTQGTLIPSSGIWSINLNSLSLPLYEGQIAEFYQREQGKLNSDSLYVTVKARE